MIGTLDIILGLYEPCAIMPTSPLYKEVSLSEKNHLNFLLRFTTLFYSLFDSTIDFKEPKPIT